MKLKKGKLNLSIYMRINWMFHEGVRGQNGNEMRGLVCMKHRVKWLVKQDE